MRDYLFVACVLTAAVAAHGAPKSEPWPRWSAHDQSATAIIDHSAWTDFLQRYLLIDVNGINRLRYDDVSESDRALLGDYLKRLSTAPISRYNRGQQRAYWINFYNALTVQLILEYMPAESIRDIDISPGLFSRGPWDKKLTTVEGEALSLNDIEHRILRPIWKDPRIHYAVNCASIGCPNLMPVAFTAGNTENLLDQGAKAYVNHPRGVAATNGKLVVSSIYHWFREDFGDSNDGVITHLRRFATPQTRAILNEYRRIGDHRYDWSLNRATNR